jgi:G3E family GTPase
MAIPVTVFTGFLGAGKTSIILSLLPQLPKEYRVVLLKNEFGEVEGCHVLIALLGSRLIPAKSR